MTKTMVKSMTGYGRAQKQTDGRDILVEIKSVNARFLEQNVRIGRNYTYLEENLKSLIKTKVSRGKVEISVSINLTEGKKADIKINEEIVRGYLDAMENYCLTHASDQDIPVDDLDSKTEFVRMKWSSLFQLPDVFRVEKVQDDEEEIAEEVLETAQQALEAFVKMRETEGEKLAEDVLNRLAYIRTRVEKIEEKAPELTQKYRERLYSKLSEILHGTTIDEQRILTEAAVFSEKTAVDEETVRLKSHLLQMKNLLDQKESVGRKLDFLVQEMNREVNTIGSKIQDIEITGIVVEMKSEIEKIREQIQNIE